MKTILSILLLLLFLPVSHAQKLVSKNSHIWFYSSTPLETIEAHNRQAVSILDPATGSLVFNLLIKSFEFKIALMQEHFNENYMESDKYPKSTFNGKIVNNSAVNYKADGVYQVQVSGDLTIHNVTRPITTNGTVEVKGNAVNAKAVFKVKPSEYGISIPSVVENKIAKDVEITVEGIYTSN
jgi:polyisoprenoid-binding protein YceI